MILGKQRCHHTGVICCVPVPVWLTIGCFAAFGVLLNYTIFGRNALAIGGNKEAAHLAGVNSGLVLVGVYALASFLGALGGVMSAGRLYSANGQLGTGYELDAIAAVIHPAVIQ